MLRCSLCRRWDAKTLTNIGLWAFVVPFAIYQGCIGEVRMLHCFFAVLGQAGLPFLYVCS